MSGRITLASDQPGPAGAPGQVGGAGVGAFGIWTPSENGFVGGNLDPALCATNLLLTAGVMFLTRVRLSVDSTIGSLKVLTRSPAGAGMSNAYLGLYSTAGTLLAQTADVSATLAATAPTSHALTAPLTGQTAGTSYYVGILVGAGTTMPTLLAPVGGFGSALLTAANSRAGQIGTGQTALPASFTPSSINTSVSSLTWCAGLGT